MKVVVVMAAVLAMACGKDESKKNSPEKQTEAAIDAKSLIPDHLPPTAFDISANHQVLKSNHGRYQECYDKAGDPSLAGVVPIEIQVDAEGKVTSASATGLNEAMTACINDVSNSLQFASGKSETVKFAIQFTGPTPQ